MEIESHYNVILNYIFWTHIYNKIIDICVHKSDSTFYVATIREHYQNQFSTHCLGFQLFRHKTVQMR